LAVAVGVEQQGLARELLVDLAVEVEMLGLLEPVHLDRGLLDNLEQTIQMAVGVEQQKLEEQMAMGKVEMVWLLQLLALL
jgi:hypothetical protein